MAKGRVLLAMSGGVDSSVCAALLLQEGYEVIGAFMKNWSDCAWRAERADALRVAAQLDIPLHTFDFEAEYRAQVFEQMVTGYAAGRTPNPDILCNQYIKFDLFAAAMERLGCDLMATGHYARRVDDATGVAHLLAGIDRQKDQSYFLCRLSQEQLQRSLFPIGHLEKHEVRTIAARHGLSVAEKKDSQGLCFVGEVALRDLLRDRIPEQSGNIVTVEGEVIGQHTGCAYYTIGQREGLGVGGGTPFFVVELRPATNEVVVAKGDDHPALFRTTLLATDLTETIPGGLTAHIGQQISARIRYRQPLGACTITPIPGGLAVTFVQPQRAVAPGQFIAFMDGDELLGSGIIA